MGRLVIIRHAETEANVSGIWHGAMDAPLTPRGRRQVDATAVRIAQLVRDCPVDHFYVSPLPRAQSTATAIAAAIQLAPTVETDLREFNLGDWEGRSFFELREREDLWGRWAADPAFAPPNGESPVTFGTRVQAVFADLLDRHPRATLLLVTHGAVISHILATRLGAGPEEWRTWEVHNCAVTIADAHASGWTMHQFNDTSHLPADALADVDHAAIYGSDLD